MKRRGILQDTKCGPDRRGTTGEVLKGRIFVGLPWSAEPILGLELRKIFTALLKPFLSQLLEGFLQEFPGFLSWFLVHYYRIQQRRFFFKLHFPFSAVWCLHFTHTSSSLPPPPAFPPLYLFIYFLNWWFQDKTTSKLLSPKGEGQTYQAKVADSMQMIKE